MVIAVLLAMVAISAGTSIALTRRWNMPTYYWRFFWSMFAFLFGVVVLCHSASVNWTNVKKGIDLNGGTILHYKNMTSDVDSGELAEALKKRIDPDGIANVTIRTLGVNKDQIEIIVPDTDEAQVDMLKKRISKIGTLEFRILANNIDNKDCFDAVQEGQDKVFLTSSKEEADAWFVPIAVGSEENFGVHVDKETGVVSGMGSGYHFTRAIANNFDTASNKAFDPKKPVVEVLVVNDRYNVEGKYLADARAGFDNAKPIVQFSFNAQGASRMSHLTSENLPVKDPGQESGRRSRQLGIILDNQIISAPNIQSQIAGNGQITGIDSQEEVDMIVSVLKAGRLPATLSTEPISEMSTGAQLGADTIERAQYAMLVSILLVMALMVYYYRFSGIVSVISLILLVLLTFAFMVSFNAAFTLPGLAGFVLTIGMVVDANILIYERIREETEAGNGVAVAVRTGFDKAFSAIVDSNITTALVGVILYTIGTQEIRGFAIILLVGIAISMFSIIYVGRGIFDLAVRSGMLREIRMRRILPKTNIPFMSYAKKTLMIAAVCVVACVLLVVARTNGVAKASSLLDIDFLGGLNVQVLFTEAQEGEDAVREKLQAANEDFTDVVVTDVTLKTDEENKLLKRRYSIITPTPKKDAAEAAAEGEDDVNESSKQIAEFKAALTEAFPGQIMTRKVEFEILTDAAPAAEPAPVPAAEPAPVPAAEPAPAPAAAYFSRPMDQMLVMSLMAQTPEAAPAAETPAAETPAAETPAAETPAAETPAVETPAVETPAVETPAVETPAVETPAVETPAAETPAAETPAAETPAAETPAAETPAEAAPQAKMVEIPEGMISVKVTFPQEMHDYAYMTSFVEDQLAKQGKVNVSYVVTNLNKTRMTAEEESIPAAEWLVHVGMTLEEAQEFFTKMKTEIDQELLFPAASTVGSAVASNMCWQGLFALVVSLIGIVLYIWLRFLKLSFGISSTMGLIHNITIALALVALSTWTASYLGFLLIDDFKISLTLLAAFLTLIGYSLNDTIVVFDRIRENRGKGQPLTKEIINKSLNDTLARTVMTSITTFIVSLALYIFGGESIHGFSFVMTVGIVVGTYSTIFVATPILYLLASRVFKDDMVEDDDEDE